VQSIALAVNESLLKSYPFLGMMPLSFAQADVNRDDIRVLNLPGASFLETVWLFHHKDTVNPVVGPALECVAATRDSLLGRRAIASSAHA
jgi:DNA-binding transcriptional LysR family regulator